MTAQLMQRHGRLGASSRKRLTQGARGFFPATREPAAYSAVDSLSSEQRQAFRNLTQFDQEHLVRVHRWLIERGASSSDLLLAGLLHDIGKAEGTHRVRFVDRVAKVMLRKLSPGTLVKLTSDYPSDRFSGLTLAVRHPEIGACRAALLGCSKRTCWLIRHHEDLSPGDDEELALLMQADFAS